MKILHALTQWVGGSTVVILHALPQQVGGYFNSPSPFWLKHRSLASGAAGAGQPPSKILALTLIGSSRSRSDDTYMRCPSLGHKLLVQGCDVPAPLEGICVFRIATNFVDSRHPPFGMGENHSPSFLNPLITQGINHMFLKNLKGFHSRYLYGYCHFVAFGVNGWVLDPNGVLWLEKRSCLHPMHDG